MHYWTLVDPVGQVAVCQLVRGVRGLEVQCAVAGSEGVLRTSHVKTLHDGFNLAEAWRATFAAKGWRRGPDVT